MAIWARTYWRRSHVIPYPPLLSAAFHDIQRVWRGALGRKRARAKLLERHKARDACVHIQKTLRGFKGRRRAREAADRRDKQKAAGVTLTRQVVGTNLRANISTTVANVHAALSKFHGSRI